MVEESKSDEQERLIGTVVALEPSKGRGAIWSLADEYEPSRRFVFYKTECHFDFNFLDLHAVVSFLSARDSYARLIAKDIRKVKGG